jgi:hypothetical protein
METLENGYCRCRLRSPQDRNRSVRLKWATSYPRCVELYPFDKYKSEVLQVGLICVKPASGVSASSPGAQDDHIMDHLTVLPHVGFYVS